ncbi:MAG: TIGR02757 family protein [Ignavibacteriaceae bacterium]
MNLREKLDFHYKAFDKSKLEPDPLQFLHLFNEELDVEVMGFIASIFAYGNVKQIITTLNKFVEVSKGKPYNFIRTFNEKTKPEISHRFYTKRDVIHLFLVLNKTYESFGSLKKLFLSFYNPDEINLKSSITKFSNYFLNEISKRKRIMTRGIKFMFPLPEKGSACKRMNLFLRWMIRKDELDFGIWNEIPSSKLVIPVDTHVARICQSLRLTNRKIPGWKMAEEITEKLKKYDPIDPVKYDFAICHIGMRKLEF